MPKKRVIYGHFRDARVARAVTAILDCCDEQLREQGISIATAVGALEIAKEQLLLQLLQEEG